MVIYLDFIIEYLKIKIQNSGELFWNQSGKDEYFIKLNDTIKDV